MTQEHSSELRAATPELEVVIRFDDPDTMSPALKEALAELADALAAEAPGNPDDEVTGFSLEVGTLGLATRPITQIRDGDSCWGYTHGEHCWWFSGGWDGSVDTCTIFSIRKIP